MLEATSKPFEEQFNTWYKKFLAEETSMNKEIKEAKDYKQMKLEQSRQDAKNTLKNYEAQQREKLEREKDKINVEKNAFDKFLTLNRIIQRIRIHFTIIWQTSHISFIMTFNDVSNNCSITNISSKYS